MAGSSEFRNVVPCLSAELGARTSNFGVPRPPSLLLQYNRQFGVLIGRWRTTLSWFRIIWSTAWMVEMGGVAMAVLCRKCGMRCEMVIDSL